MDPNNSRTIESFVRAFEIVAGIIKEKEPDCIVAPMFGAVPFIDVLNIIDDDFPNEKVEYVPASNKIYRVRDVLRASFEALIDAYAPEGGTFLSLDEVVSGSSLVRVKTQFDAAKTNYANKKTIELYKEKADFRKKHVSGYRDLVRDSINYLSIGIVDSKFEKKGQKKSLSYEELLQDGSVIPVPVECIITMDRPEFFPASYQTTRDAQGKTIYLPVVDSFNISKEYVDFLTQVASIFGKDPARVTVSNLAKIRGSYQWVPENLRSI